MEIKREDDINREGKVISERPTYPMSTFKNLGGTCPLNSVLICLLATGKLIKFYKDEESWKNKIRVDLRTMNDPTDKSMKGIIRSEITDKYIEEYIKNSVSDHFLCIIKNYFVKPSVLISPIKFCDTIFNKSVIYNDIHNRWAWKYETKPININTTVQVCKAHGGLSIHEFRVILWNMINETCYHIDDDEYVPKMLYSLVSLEDYEKLSEREKTIKMKILNTINEISFVKVNILRYELLRFESKLVGFKSKKKRSSILEMFGIYKKNIYNCSRCGITLEYKVDVDVTCLEQITKSNIINRLIYDTGDFRSECPKCGKDGIKNTVILGLSNILVIMINFSGVIENNVENIKNTHELLYDEIDLTGCIERCDKDYKYKAYAIVQFPIGHFRTLAKHNGKWFVFDDDSVKELDEGKFIKEIHKYGIYMLFLERF